MKSFILKQINRIIELPLGYSINKIAIKGEEVSNTIYKELLDDKPSLIAKIGWTEANCILSCTNLILHNFRPEKLILRLASNSQKKIKEASGFFPNDKKNIHKFAELYLSCLSNIDVFGSWMNQEKYFKNYLTNSTMVSSKDFDPLLHQNPWSRVLKNKRVLIIHPFSNTIKNQYRKRNSLFENNEILPEFKLITITAVQSRANNKVDFDSWWQAFDYMKSEIDKEEFDIAILGCGSYSLPLADYIKAKGKKAIHLGGNTQLLFGIIGSRWAESDDYKGYINEYWIRPLKSDTPKNIHKTDSYW
jgi:hypothetical protein